MWEQKLTWILRYSKTKYLKLKYSFPPNLIAHSRLEILSLYANNYVLCKSVSLNWHHFNQNLRLGWSIWLAMINKDIHGLTDGGWYVLTYPTKCLICKKINNNQACPRNAEKRVPIKMGFEKQKFSRRNFSPLESARHI